MTSENKWEENEYSFMNRFFFFNGKPICFMKSFCTGRAAYEAQARELLEEHIHDLPWNPSGYGDKKPLNKP